MATKPVTLCVAVRMWVHSKTEPEYGDFIFEAEGDEDYYASGTLKFEADEITYPGDRYEPETTEYNPCISDLKDEFERKFSKEYSDFEIIEFEVEEVA